MKALPTYIHWEIALGFSEIEPIAQPQAGLTRGIYTNNKDKPWLKAESIRDDLATYLLKQDVSKATIPDQNIYWDWFAFGLYKCLVGSESIPWHIRAAHWEAANSSVRCMWDVLPLQDNRLGTSVHNEEQDEVVARRLALPHPMLRSLDRVHGTHMDPCDKPACHCNRPGKYKTSKTKLEKNSLTC